MKDTKRQRRFPGLFVGSCGNVVGRNMILAVWVNTHSGSAADTAAGAVAGHDHMIWLLE
ncbi:hypothetical protein SS05631_a45640 (plasmid) [Sinorhizobium sp. CCBAU 05631]|nr:hypothetical protein SS05631_a45640 [Sinorhizobium sp. CCBAU 05631]